jgi:hypothetical protein
MRNSTLDRYDATWRIANGAGYGVSCQRRQWTAPRMGVKASVIWLPLVSTRLLSHAPCCFDLAWRSATDIQFALIERLTFQFGNLGGQLPDKVLLLD